MVDGLSALPVDAGLPAAGSFSPGQISAWKYELSSHDHSLVQGGDVVNRLLRSVPERTYYGDLSDEER